MDKELLTIQYILSRKYYLEGELERCRATLKEFSGSRGREYYELIIGKLQGEIEAYECELDALKHFYEEFNGKFNQAEGGDEE